MIVRQQQQHIPYSDARGWWEDANRHRLKEETEGWGFKVSEGLGVKVSEKDNASIFQCKTGHSRKD